MNMKKILKIALIVVISYFTLGTLLGIYNGLSKGDTNYQVAVRFYNDDKLCYECFLGTETGICPKIYPGSIKKSYPKAIECREGEICPGPYECDWRYDGGLNEQPPVSDLSSRYYSFRQNWENSWHNYFLITFVILTLGLVPLG